MDREAPQVKGWRQWRFNYGSLAVEITTSTDSRLQEELLNHIDELAYGGWSIRHPSVEELDNGNS